MSISWPGGERAEPEGKDGVATLADAMLFLGSEQLQAASIEAGPSAGASIRFNHGEGRSYVEIEGLTSHFDETLALVRELVQQPAMRVADFERSRFDHVQWLQQLMQDPQWQADWQFGALLEGRKRPDLLASVRALTLDDVRNFYQSVYRSGEAQVVVSGDLAQERVMKALGFLVEPAGQPPALHSLGWRGQQARRAIYLLDNPGAALSQIRVGRRAMAEDAFGEHYLTRLMNVSLAERLHIRLREELGYTYFIDAAFDGNADVGHFLLQSSVRSGDRGSLAADPAGARQVSAAGADPAGGAYPAGSGAQWAGARLRNVTAGNGVHVAHSAQGVAGGLCGAAGAAGEPALSLYPA